MRCDNPVDDPHEITDRTLTVGFAVDWGAEDLRAVWQGTYHFDSFRCLAVWAQARADDHDGRFLVEGSDKVVAAEVDVLESPVKATQAAEKA